MRAQSAAVLAVFGAILGFAVVLFIIFSSEGGGGGTCPSRSGSKLCGYCSEDAALSDNPNAGKCRYCPSGTSCVLTEGDICGELRCRDSEVTGGATGGGGGTTRQYCNTGDCYSGGHCCPGYARYWCKDGCYDSRGANANGCYTLKATCY